MGGAPWQWVAADDQCVKARSCTGCCSYLVEAGLQECCIFISLLELDFIPALGSRCISGCLCETQADQWEARLCLAGSEQLLV